jgi:hypothetical protein
MSFGDCKDMELWEATRRRFLKILALTGTVLSVDLFGPSKKMGFGKEGDMTPEEMREKRVSCIITSDSTEARPFLRSAREIGEKDWEVVRAWERLRRFGANGELCGSLVGALAVLGLKFGRNREDEKEDPRMWSYTRELLKRFREEIVQSHGGIRCLEIAGVDWRNREQVQSFYNGEKFLECARIVGDTAKLTGELLERPI